jgi:UDP-glucose 4-epimerase
LFSGKNQEQVEVFNLGTGNGVSILEIIKSFEQISAQQLQYQIAPRRAGDVVAIYANNDKAKSAFGWEAKHTLDDMMRTAWNWDKKNSFI